jgi:hypothetical protein
MDNVKYFLRVRNQEITARITGIAIAAFCILAGIEEIFYKNV